MRLYRQFVLVLFAALFMAAQQEAAVHAIGHLPELLGGQQQSDDDEAASHKCPDCARFASVSVGAATSACPTLPLAQAGEPIVHPALVAIVGSPLERPRIRGPPRS